MKSKVMFLPLQFIYVITAHISILVLLQQSTTGWVASGINLLSHGSGSCTTKVKVGGRFGFFSAYGFLHNHYLLSPCAQTWFPLSAHTPGVSPHPNLLFQSI